jgi:hypothetical protein
MEYLRENDTKEFIRRLPELTVNPLNVHLLMLAVRSRKAKEILGEKIHDIVVERKIIRPIPDWKSRYFNGVYNLSILQHQGRFEFNNILIPAQTMGIFATLSPRNVLASNADLMKENITYFYQNDETSRMELAKISSRYFGTLHKHKDRNTNFVTLDLDNGDKALLKEILDKVSILPIFMVTETSRGFHIVLDISKSENAKIFYGEEALIQKLGLEYAKKGLEIQKDSQEPVPGTLYYRPKGEIHYVTILQ